ncbi:HepT-like ribonuclease domain-containing protein [Leptolyngbya sp. PCC 6406]|uniref:HepT-like ribonuclease domain-containing protein n=1 Tax=Leptolyngbya sp. PCC 6406 TaxID=1173264 RepID=UPI00090754A7
MSIPKTLHHHVRERIPDSVRSRYPDIPWRDMAGMQDKLIHNYFNTESLWHNAPNRPPPITSIS